MVTFLVTAIYLVLFIMFYKMKRVMKGGVEGKRNEIDLIGKHINRYK